MHAFKDGAARGSLGDLFDEIAAYESACLDGSKMEGPHHLTAMAVRHAPHWRLACLSSKMRSPLLEKLVDTPGFLKDLAEMYHESRKILPGCRWMARELPETKALIFRAKESLMFSANPESHAAIMRTKLEEARISKDAEVSISPSQRIWLVVRRCGGVSGALRSMRSGAGSAEKGP